MLFHMFVLWPQEHNQLKSFVKSVMFDFQKTKQKSYESDNKCKVCIFQWQKSYYIT